LFPILFLAGCAAPGEPTERKPPTPEPVKDLAASQAGNAVTLKFALPGQSVEKRQIEQPLSVQVYRVFRPTAGGAALGAVPSNPMLLVTIPPAMLDHYMVQGRVQFVDTLRAEDFAPSGGCEAEYFVRTFVSPKKLSPNSNAASITIYPAADPITDLKAEKTRTGVTLSWTPPAKTVIGPAPGVALYRVYRKESEAAETSEASGNALGTIDTDTTTTKSPFVRVAEIPSPPFTDTQTQLGKRYMYTVRSVIQYPSGQLESADSNFASITPKDIFPPAAPENLVVVYVPAVAGSPAYLELSWAINPATDIAGYNVYRSEEASRAGVRLNSELLLTPSFRDMNVLPGHSYSYTVTAVDRSGNEGLASSPVSGSVPAENQ